MLWSAKINGVGVWVYRWQHTALHVVEIISKLRLKDHINIGDGEKVYLYLDDEQVTSIPLLEQVTWSLVWVGRKRWVYTRDRYDFRLLKYCIALGATQKAKKAGYIKTMLKKLIKSIPIFGPIAKSLVMKSAQPRIDTYVFERIPSDQKMDATTNSVRMVINLLGYAKSSGSAYSAKEFPAGYHTIEFLGQTLKGQRVPSARLDLVPYDFTGKTVLDIGSNQGGMLLALAERIRWGVGIDYDHRLVNAANWIRSARGQTHVNFFVFNLEEEPMDLIEDLLPENRADICFLLTVCMWVNNWRDVIDAAHYHSEAMLFESNGTDEQQNDQIAYLRQKYERVEMLAEASTDDHQKRRKLMLLTNPVR